MTDDADEMDIEDPDERREVWREGVSMALYVSLSLLAVLSAFPPQDSSSDRTVAFTVFLTSVGLVLAHQVAFRMSSKLVGGGRLEPFTFQLLQAQLAGGAVATVLATVPVLIAGAAAVTLSIGLLLAFVTVVAYFIARSVPVSRARALTYVLIVALAVIAVLAVKSLVNH